MGNNDVGRAIGIIVKELFDLYDLGSISHETLRSFIEFCNELAESFGSEADLVMSLNLDRCSCCFKIVEDTGLIDYRPTTVYGAKDPRVDFSETAFNNCFGPVMVGGKVCVECARKLRDAQT